MIKQVYSCYNKNNTERMKSSSGGIYILLAKNIIKLGGVIYAAVYCGTDVEHRKITQISEIFDSCGSKYIPSKLGNTFRNIVNDLKDNHQVLFVGTPCQCEGLLSLVGDDRNLICIDFVCHGIPSKLAWEKYLEDINKSGSDIVASINMRDKSTGWSKLQYSFSITMKDGNIIKEKFPYNHYLRGFVSDYYLRPSCYDCKFKGVNRRTDITLGDYWGVWDIQPEMDDNKGTSLVLIHSEKGLNIFLSIIDDIISKEAILEKAITNNRSIVESAQYSDNRKVFFERIQKGDSFCKIIDDMTGYSLKSKIKNKTKKILKKIRLECQK